MEKRSKMDILAENVEEEKPNAVNALLSTTFEEKENEYLEVQDKEENEFKRPNRSDQVPTVNKPMTSAQHRHLAAALRALKRLKDASWFLHPVDAVKLNIPDYYHVIKNPMDLSTIDKKHAAQGYFTVDAFVADFDLIVSNCISYNGRDSPFAEMANNLRKQLDKHLQRLPPMEVEEYDSYSSAAAVLSASQKKSKKSPEKYEENADKELLYGLSVVEEFFDKKNSEIAHLFLCPVDRKQYSQYYDVIKQPMDFGTIKKRLESKYYTEVADFENDVALVFKNCYKYNPVGNPVRQFGTRLEALWKQRWSERFSDKKPKKAPKTSRNDRKRVADSSDEDEMQLIQQLDQQTNTLKQQIESLKQKIIRRRKKSEKKYPASPEPMDDTPKRKPVRSKPQSRPPRPQIDEPMIDITYEMKRQLSEKINDLSHDKLQRVIQIIQDSVPQLSEGVTDEIELDIASLDKLTLHRLWKLVCEDCPKKKPSKKTQKRSSPSSMPTALSSVVRGSSEEDNSDSSSGSTGSESD